MKKLGMILLVCVVLFPLMGCKTTRAAAARDQYIYDATANHVYPLDCARVLGDARTLLFERGYSVKTVDSQAMIVETEWLFDVENVGKRYLVQATAPAENSCQVRMTSSIDTEGRIDTARDLPTEWDLLRRAHPAAASEIQSEADTIYMRMRNE